MRFPFRIVTATRLERIEQIEKIHDLAFMRDALEGAIEVVRETADELQLGHGTPGSNYQHIPEEDSSTRDEIARLRLLRINLSVCLWRIGGKKQ